MTDTTSGPQGPEQLDLLLVCSSGGHLAHLMTVKEWWEKYPHRWVTFDLPDAQARLVGEDVIWSYHPVTRNVRNFFRNLGVAVRVMRERRPDVIVSTGAGVAVPFFILAKILGIPAVFIEVLDRFDTPTMTGRICRYLTPYIAVQIPEQLAVYPKARLIGPMV